MIQMRIPGIKDIQKNELWRNLFKMLTSAFVAQVIPILIYPLLTRIFQPEQFGLLALFQGICAILIIPATGRYEFAVMLPDKDEDAWNILGFGVILGTLISFLCFLAGAIFEDPLSRMTGNPAIKPWMPLISVSVFLSAIFLFFTYWANRKKDYSFMATYTVSQSLSISVAKLGFGFAGFKAGGLISGTLAGQFISSVFLGFQISRKYRSMMQFLNKKEMLIQAMRFIKFPKFRMLHALTNVIAGNLPVFIFTSYFSPATAGLWSLAFGVVFKPTSLFAGSVTQVFSQRLIERSNQGEVIHPQVKEIMAKLFLLGIVPFILAGIFAPWIFRLVFGPEWYTAGRYLQIMVPWLFTLYLAFPFSFIADLAGKQGMQFVLAFANLVLRFIALVVGIITKNIWLSLVLLSIGGIAINIYYLLWYLKLSRNVMRSSYYFPGSDSSIGP